MASIRVFKHYLHFPFIILGLLESLAYVSAICVAIPTRLYISQISFDYHYMEVLPSAIAYAYTMLICMNALGVYQAKLKEGQVGMLVRTLVAFAIGSLIFPVFYYIASDIFGVIWRSVLLLATIYSFVFVICVRTLFYYLVDENTFKRNVLVYGSGQRANQILKELTNPEDWKGFNLIGFVSEDGETPCVPEKMILHNLGDLRDYVVNNDIDEIVIALDDRRKRLPMDKLMACKLEGIGIVQESHFTEREARKVSLDNISPSWFIFSEGFGTSTIGEVLKRGFDLLASVVLLGVSWPFMLITAIAIKLEEGWKAPVFYSQERVGLNGVPFKVMKFRSMRTDAEKGGKAIWASKNDSRVTKVGAIIRKYRIDELPQLFNVFTGDMAFVGPRPERPVFVEQLSERIPFYNERHRVKPGITGWAQLCFAYADTEEDTKEKLRYDLYYLKNHSLLLDALILLQTVEVVLFKKGAH
ncbi:MAG: sugar transferase [Gammaproteobacteria bacterium]|nr:MAG: sugar transferase [Gammaproteobacteria bacterium]